MVATTPYIIRAIYDWCQDESLTPHLLVDAEYPGVVVPVAHVVDGAITLNVSMDAVRNLELGNDWILFSARFGGKAMEISVPVSAVRAVYAQENGVGVGFPEEEAGPVGASPLRAGTQSEEDIEWAEKPRDEDKPDMTGKPASDSKRKGRGHLKLVE